MFDLGTWDCGSHARQAQVHSADTAREANECVLLLEEQLQVTIQTKGKELADLTAKLGEMEVELVEARAAAERAQVRPDTASALAER